MENAVVACVQQRMGIFATREEYQAEVHRFMHQARAKVAQLVIFPELAGTMLAPPLISRAKLGFIKRADQGGRPTAGFVSRGLGQVSGAAAGVLGGGFRGSLGRLLKKDSAALRDVYLETFGTLAREYGTAIVGGTLYIHDEEADALRSRAYLFDVNGDVLGYQDKLNLTPDEESFVTPGTGLNALETRFGRIGLLIGRDTLYPELARSLAIQGAELLVSIAASPGVAQGSVIRSAMTLRAEENQVFAAASFLLGPNYLGQASREDYFGKSALLAPVSLTAKGNGVLVQAGTDRTEGLIAAELDAEALHTLWETSGFRPRAQMNLGGQGPALAEFYREGSTIEQALSQRAAEPVELGPALQFEQIPEPEGVELEDLSELSAELPEPEGTQPADPVELASEPLDTEPEELLQSVPEALSLTRKQEGEQE